MQIKTELQNRAAKRYKIELTRISPRHSDQIDQITVDGLNKISNSADQKIYLGSDKAINEFARKLDGAKIINSDEAVSIARSLDNLLIEAGAEAGRAA